MQNTLTLSTCQSHLTSEGDETAWRQGRPPGGVELQVSELDLSGIDSDSNEASIFGMCLHGFIGDAWMSDAEGAQDDMGSYVRGGQRPWSKGTSAPALHAVVCHGLVSPLSFSPSTDAVVCHGHGVLGQKKLLWCCLKKQSDLTCTA